MSGEVGRLGSAGSSWMGSSKSLSESCSSRSKKGSTPGGSASFMEVNVWVPSEELKAVGVVTGRLRGKKGHTGLEVATRSGQNMSIDEKSLRCVHPPRLSGASREGEDLCIDELPVHDRIPHRLLHRMWREERRLLLCRYGTPRNSHHRREWISVAGVWRNRAPTDRFRK